ncbi:MAG: phosphopyruvate hydratase [Thermoproteota archaeon]|nr:phosphopyruvate hydratase [Candidatus Korarchaeota archaeon]RLG43481.1 MAG: phosphopyruvate hydratase [Candidatus Korarchaeota archaeon]
MSFRIRDIRARQILDSRGNPTLEVITSLEGGGTGSFSVPSGASKGEKEAIELRDGGKFLKGKGVLRAIRNVNEVIRPALVGKSALRQHEIDSIMLEIDGTSNKSRLGANAILGVSVSVAKAASNQLGLPIYRYIGGVNAKLMPVPFMNIINGGAHAGNDLAIQEFMIVPSNFRRFKEALFAGVEVYMTLRDLLKGKYGRTSINVGDEGGFAPPMKETEEAIEYLIKSIEESGYGGKIFVALDCAANSFYDEKIEKYKIDGKELGPADLIDFYLELISKYPIVSIEDPFYEGDWDSLVEFTKELGNKVQIVGDDFFVSNPDLLRKGIELGAANALLLKVNQIGTLTEALSSADLAFRNGYSVMVSHRSGETIDEFIADLSVALNSGQIKAGAPARGERISKYNRLLEIEEELGSMAEFIPLSSQLGI